MYNKKTCNKRYVDDRTTTLELYRHKHAKLSWKMLKQSAHRKSPDIPVSSFEEYFKAVNKNEDPFFQVDEDIVHFNERFVRDEFQVMFHELDTDVSLDENNKSIKQLKLSKSTGPDNYLNEYFIHGNTVLIPYLQSLFSVIFKTGYISETWSAGYIVPLHKKDLSITQ